MESDNKELIGGLGSSGLPEDDGNRIAHDGVAYIFKSNRDAFPAKPYHEDGNPDMYTDEKLKERALLKTSAIVDAAIRSFMQKHFTKQKAGTYSKEEYLRVFSKVGGALRPTMDPDDLLKELKRDFENDTRDKVEVFEPKKDGEEDEGKNDTQQKKVEEPEAPITYDYLDETKLYEALYELADHWCLGTDDIEIKEFFKHLEFRMNYQGMNDGKAYEGVL